MRKQILSIALGLTALALVILLSGCSGSKLSGTYVNPDDSSNYVVFEGKTVTLYEDGNKTISGTFTESAKSASGYLLIITYEGSSPEHYWLDENKNTISFGVDSAEGIKVGEVAFVKEK